jgi:hypothetical protein
LIRRLALALALTAGCNAILGVDEQGLRPPIEDAGVRESGPPRNDRCVTDADCMPPNGCYTPRCDTVLGACVYTICESKLRACRASRCAPGPLTCDPNAERDYAFKTTGFNVPDVSLGCLGDPSACVVAVHPFLFVGTKSGVAAILVDDLLATSARTVPVRGFDLPAARIVASGRRVWFLGAVQGAAPPYRILVGWLDVPSTPLVTALEAKLSTFAYSYPNVTAFPAPDGGLYVALNDASQGLPTALLVPPLPPDGVLGLAGNVPDGGAPTASLPNPTHVMHRVPNAPPGSALVASSANRLVAFRFASTFNLVRDPAKEGALAGPDAVVVPGPNVLGAPRFASGPDGVVAHTMPVDPAPTDCNCLSQQRLFWTLPNAAATTFEAGQSIAYEGYMNPSMAGCRGCTTFSIGSLAAWIDGKTILTAAPAGDMQRTQTAVRVVQRDPLAAPPAKRFVTVPAEQGNFAVHKVALTSSAGFGYLFVADAEGNNVAVSIFDPRCENQP